LYAMVRAANQGADPGRRRARRARSR
jgi:hypothetical protein